MKIDFIIVGQGLAGSLLFMEMDGKGMNVLLIDPGNKNCSSQVAAGMWNPIVFKRINKSWKVDELFPVMEEVYTDLERRLGGKYFNSKQIIRLFNSFEEQNNWSLKVGEGPYSSYIFEKSVPELKEEKIHKEFGYGVVKKAGHINLPDLLQDVRLYAQKRGKYLEEEFSHDRLVVENNKVQYAGYEAKGIIFCEGFQIYNNPYFNWLPAQKTKGELLTVRIKDLQIEPILNKGVFVLPIGDDLYKVGATYSWNNMDLDPTDEAKEELLEKLSHIVKKDVEVIKHEVGIRPTVTDRRPLLGVHPKYSNLYVFNGLGTKGVMLAPFFSKQMAEVLTGDINGPEPEVDIKRFYKHYPEM